MLTRRLRRRRAVYLGQRVPERSAPWPAGETDTAFGPGPLCPFAGERDNQVWDFGGDEKGFRFQMSRTNRFNVAAARSNKDGGAVKSVGRSARRMQRVLAFIITSPFFRGAGSMG